MILIPAIDIQTGKVVRLKQGRFDEVTVYSEDPVKTAQHWEALGAPRLHLVDLDGAQTGELKNLEIIRQIAKTVKIPIQIGGGIRSETNVRLLLNPKNSGLIDRVILGTSAVEKENRELLNRLLREWPSQIAVSLDCANGFVTSRGWSKPSAIKGIDLARDLEQWGIRCLVYTDISRDGMLKGPDLDGLTELLNSVKIDVIASGGISGLADIKNLLALKAKNLTGAITGKAIYEGKLDFKKAAALCSTKG